MSKYKELKSEDIDLDKNSMIILDKRGRIEGQISFEELARLLLFNYYTLNKKI